MNQIEENVIKATTSQKLRLFPVQMIQIAGHVGFMGNGDLWGLIFTHKSLSGFMGINGDLWGFMDRPGIL